jgi:hypothetical protein
MQEGGCTRPPRTYAPESSLSHGEAIHQWEQMAGGHRNRTVRFSLVGRVSAALETIGLFRLASYQLSGFHAFFRQLRRPSPPLPSCYC